MVPDAENSSEASNELGEARPSTFLRLIAAYSGSPTGWNTVVVWILGRFGRLLALLIPFFIATQFGATRETDVFFFVFASMLYISSLFGPMQERLMAPYIEEAREEGRDVGTLVGQIIGVSGVATAIGLLAVALAGRPFFALVTGFSREHVSLAYGMLLELAPLALFSVWSSALSATLTSYGKRDVVSQAQFVHPVAMLIVSTSLIGVLGIHAVAVGYILAELLRMSILLTYLVRHKICSIHFSTLYDVRVRQYFRVALYTSIGSAAVGLNPLVDLAMASWLTEGSVSLLHYAHTIYGIPLMFITGKVILAVLAPWKQHFAEGGIDKLRRDTEKLVWIVSLLSAVIAFLLIAFHSPIARLLLAWSPIDNAGVRQTGRLFMCYLLGFVPFMIGRVYIQAHQVIQSFPIFASIGPLNCILNIVMNLTLIQFFGIYGIPLGTSAVNCIVTLVLIAAFRARCTKHVLTRTV